MTTQVGCELASDFTSSADKTFGCQNFTSAVALIELHNTRNGSYPDSLNDLEYLGDWDAIWLGAVQYEKVSDGYNLYVERGWVGEPELSFPEDYKNGLGLKDSNITWTAEPTASTDCLSAWEREE
ncbi:MAG: hypothetical protein QNJ46_32180 [Leptolyngbyaceae cyanobacterium MO_188.B28]|nr:hypothetical protein [Leptolyngbyaceae cyanobacterium MO_188.B28]